MCTLRYSNLAPHCLESNEIQICNLGVLHVSISQGNVQSVALTVKSKMHTNHLNVYSTVNLKVGGNPWPNTSGRGQSRARASDGVESELASMQIYICQYKMS